MALSSLQARALMLKSQILDNEAEQSHISDSILALNDAATVAAEKYRDGINATKLIFATADGEQNALSLSTLATNGYHVVDAYGRAVVDKDDPLSSIPSSSHMVQSIPTDTFESLTSFEKEKVDKKFSGNMFEVATEEFQVQKYNPQTADELETDEDGLVSTKLTSTLLEKLEYDASKLLGLVNNGTIEVIDNEGNKITTNGNGANVSSAVKDAINTVNGVNGGNGMQKFAYDVTTLTDTTVVDNTQVSTILNNLNSTGGDDGPSTPISYVFSSEQYVRAMLNSSRFDNVGKLTSSAKIVMMNDIDFSNLTSEVQNENGGKISKLQSILLEYAKSEKYSGNNARAYFEKYLGKYEDGKFACEATSYNFKNDDNADDTIFNSEYTNCIKVDSFTGGIFGQGFDMIGVDIVTQRLGRVDNTETAAMFGTIENNAIFQDVSICNANVVALNVGGTQKGDDKVKNTNNMAAILAMNVGDQALVKNIVASGEQLSFYGGVEPKQQDGKSVEQTLNNIINGTYTLGEFSYNVSINAGYGIVQNDNRHEKTLEEQGMMSFGLDQHTGWHYLSDNGLYTDGDKTRHDSNNDDEKDGRNYRMVAKELGSSRYLARDQISSWGYSRGVTNDHWNKNFKYTGLSYSSSDNTLTTYLNCLITNLDSLGSNTPFQLNIKVDPSILYDSDSLESSSSAGEFTEEDEIDNWDNDYQSNESEGISFEEIGDPDQNGYVTMRKTYYVETQEYLDAMDELATYSQMGNMSVASSTSNPNDKKNATFSASIVGVSIPQENLEEYEEYQSNSFDYEIIETSTRVTVNQRVYKDQIQNGLISEVSNPDALLEENIRNGTWRLVKYNDELEPEEAGWSEAGVKEVEDEEAIKQAEMEYELTSKKLQAEEEKLDMRMTELQTSYEALSTEYESVQKLLDKEIEKIGNMYA